MGLTVWFRPPLISRRPSILMSKYARVSLTPSASRDPRYCCCGVTAHHNRTPLCVRPVSYQFKHDPRGHNHTQQLEQVDRDKSLVDRLFSLALRSDLSASRISKTPSSRRQNRPLPRNWRQTGSAFLRVVVWPCSRKRLAPHLRVVVRDRWLTFRREGQRETLYRVLPYGSGLCYGPISRSNLCTKYLPAHTTYVRLHNLRVMLSTSLAIDFLLLWDHCSNNNLCIASIFFALNAKSRGVGADSEA